MTNRLKYPDLPENIDYLTAIAHSAEVLEAAGRLAFKEKDYEAMTKIGAMYLELGVQLAGLTELVEQEEDVDVVDAESESSFGGFGFGHTGGQCE